MVRSGWYETLRPASGTRLRRTVYLAWFPEEGPCIADGRDGFMPLLHELEGWEWHGPFRSADASRAADLSRQPALPHPFDA